MIEAVEDVGFGASLSKEKKFDMFRKLTEIEYYKRMFFISLVFMCMFGALMVGNHIPGVGAWLATPLNGAPPAAPSHMHMVCCVFVVFFNLLCLCLCREDLR